MTSNSSVSEIEQRVRDSFSRQGAMRTLGARLLTIQPGSVDLAFDWAEGLTQQHGFLHAGMQATALDSACGFAALSLMPAEAGILSIEFKTNLLATARGQRFRVEGRVLKPGRTIMVAESRLYAHDANQERLASTMTCTLMCIQGREGIRN